MFPARFRGAALRSGSCTLSTCRSGTILVVQVSALLCTQASIKSESDGGIHTPHPSPLPLPLFYSYSNNPTICAMKFTSTLIAVFAICAQLANGSAIATRGEERRTPYNTICTSTCAGPVSDDCTAMANGLFGAHTSTTLFDVYLTRPFIAQGNTPLYMGAGTNLEYNQGTCRMVFYVDAQDTITYSKFGIVSAYLCPGRLMSICI